MRAAVDDTNFGTTQPNLVYVNYNRASGAELVDVSAPPTVASPLNILLMGRDPIYSIRS